MNHRDGIGEIKEAASERFNEAREQIDGTISDTARRLHETANNLEKYLRMSGSEASKSVERLGNEFENRVEAVRSTVGETAERLSKDAQRRVSDLKENAQELTETADRKGVFDTILIAISVIGIGIAVSRLINRK